MRRIYISNLNENSKNIIIKKGDREFHHLKNVLRAAAGDVFEGFNGNGIVAQMKIIKVENNTLYLESVSVHKDSHAKQSNINLAVAVVKRKYFNFILKTAVQMGVKNIYPFICEYSYTKKIAPEIIDKWNTVIIEAAKQSGNNHLTFIKKIYTFKDILDSDIRNICYFDKNGESIYNNKIKSFKKNEDILLIIGPEGGLSKQEKKYLKDKGANCYGLNFNVLRTEIAVVSILSLIKYIAGEA